MYHTCKAHVEHFLVYISHIWSTLSYRSHQPAHKKIQGGLGTTVQGWTQYFHGWGRGVKHINAMGKMVRKEKDGAWGGGYGSGGVSHPLCPPPPLDPPVQVP